MRQMKRRTTIKGIESRSMLERCVATGSQGVADVSPMVQARLPDVSEMKHFFGIVLASREWWKWKCIRIKRLLLVVRNLL
ncbi:hypothetical protein [Pandoraea apista]|uniref:Uncharacterized protein n=1 Tax=Pandoraea apista TaxID=93218 RepID=A0ABX9ZRG2_9BURK|nr:hypothetical protein [Pandoraea apista]RRJ32119.1 hypothetical protein EIB05_10490 [Pandoraea apista]RRJ80250.1 hypothetical protein EIL82_09955 [Pandoraea apista]RSD16752.1 hypothetical protein EIZ52_14695 [Pandoraea apista]RSD18416.1 hypothetical protein EJB12_01525 [Pandoraea apista]RSD18465.1 hypothetical protein EJB12_01840 [Pandoraea apista]